MKKFFSYVEITTKITSIFPFFMTIAYLFYIKQPINGKLTLFFFSSMFLFDLTTTAINNYIDTKTNHQVLQFKRSFALFIIFMLLIISAALGIYLVYLTDLVVLVLGGMCFLCGVLYSYGPIPLSRQPLGEIFSGIFYGLLIPFILLYINMPEQTFFSYQLSFQTISINFEILPIITVLLISIAPICATANIMLANNICDLENDIKVKRFTLPYYLEKKALYLFAGLYYVIYLATIILVILNILSPLCLLSLLTIIIVQKNINLFFKKQEKKTTFILSVKNYIIIIGTNSILILLSGFFR